MQVQAVLLDWDGTVVDSWLPHAEAARVALAGTLGREPLGEEVRQFLLAPDNRACGLDAARYVGAWEAIQPLYRRLQGGVRTFPGIERELLALRSGGASLAIVTSKRRWAVQGEIRRLGLGDLFDAVVCRDDTARHKPDPDPLLRALDEIAAGSDAVFVGDAATDILAARAAGVRAVGVAWGWEGVAGLLLHAPDAICMQVPDLAAVVSALPAGDAVRRGQRLG